MGSRFKIATLRRLRVRWTKAKRREEAARYRRRSEVKLSAFVHKRHATSVTPAEMLL
jgi:hypothetical protein